MQVIGQFSEQGDGIGQVGRPHNISTDSKGNVYVSEGNPPGTELGRRAQKFVLKGIVASGGGR